jgi:hypothetical protein
MARKSRFVPDISELRARFLSPRAEAAALAVAAGSDEVELWKHFSLVEGGPLYRLGHALGLTGGALGLVRIGLAVAFFTWLPLAALTLIPHDMPVGPSLPFILSFGTHARLLVAIPLMFVAEAVFDARIRQALNLIVESRLVPDRQRSTLNGVLQDATRLRDVWHIEALVIALTLGLIAWEFRADLPLLVPSWRTGLGGHRTAAGWWYGLVAIPIFQFLLWRWCARLLVWWYVLWRIGRLDLHLIPTHPDLSAGLGSFGVAHVALAPLGFSWTAIVAGTFAEQILYAGAKVQDYTLTLVGIVAGTSFVLIAPLLRFTWRLIDVRQRGLIDYGALATRYVRAFDAKWLRQYPPPDEPLLGSADIQSLADLSNSFEVITRMRYVPLSMTQFLILVAVTAAPAAPLVLFVIPFNDLILRGLHTLLLV